MLLTLAMYGFHRSMLMYLYYRNRGADPAPRARASIELPIVTVQLPLFNEMYVARAPARRASRSIDYPRDKLEIQVLDDSTDETQRSAAPRSTSCATRGFDISYIHRTDRTGFKAGALENGLKTARGEFVMVFDADFLPPADIIERTDPLLHRPKVGMVQARWGHLNRDYSLLTRAAGDDARRPLRHRAHRAPPLGPLLQLQRHRRHLAPHRHRRRGRLAHDTLTEDMDLSYRAQLSGWQFVYLPRTWSRRPSCRCEMNALQVRSSSAGPRARSRPPRSCCRRSCAPTCRSSVKIEAFFHLTNNFAYPLLLLLVDAAAAEPARAHAPRLARGAAHRPAAVLRHHAVDRVASTSPRSARSTRLAADAARACR